METTVLRWDRTKVSRTDTHRHLLYIVAVTARRYLKRRRGSYPRKGPEPWSGL